MKTYIKILICCLFVFGLLLIFPNNSYASEFYTIQQGDTLSKIAKKYYNDANKWNEIYEANKDLIKNPNLIHIGWKITIPDISINKETPTQKVSRNDNFKDILQCKATAYDLSVQSCGKLPSHKEYGITYSGRSIAGKTRLEAACVAVDPKVIPLGSLLYINFDDYDYKQYNGIYQALDIGGGVKGKHVDIFLGDFNSTKEHKKVTNFGVTKCTVLIIRNGW